jgi:hypothetical protein
VASFGDTASRLRLLAAFGERALRGFVALGAVGAPAAGADAAGADAAGARGVAGAMGVCAKAGAAIARAAAIATPYQRCFMSCPLLAV